MIRALKSLGRGAGRILVVMGTLGVVVPILLIGAGTALIDMEG